VTDAPGLDDSLDDSDDARGPDRRGDLDDATLEALGKLSEGMEYVERARGHLYSFHQLSGTADLTIGKAADAFREAGHDAIADEIETELVGRNLLEGRWSFQIVEEYDDGYWSVVRDHERRAREQLAGGRRHVFEASMKENRRTHGQRHHEARPGE
jgi:hypothetical protein